MTKLTLQDFFLVAYVRKAVKIRLSYNIDFFQTEKSEENVEQNNKKDF